MNLTDKRDVNIAVPVRAIDCPYCGNTARYTGDSGANWQYSLWDCLSWYCLN